MKLITQKKIKTPEGDMIPIFKDWENEGYEPKMVYLTTMIPGTTKGPILHKERKYFVSATTGTIDIEFLFEGKIKTVNLHDEANPTVYNTLILEEDIPVRFISRGTEIGTIVNCPSKAWHPDNPDTFKYSSWEDYLNRKE
jgi:hypothetical protein